MALDAPPGCGDGVKAGVEQCDGSDVGSATCASTTAPGWVGTLTCTSLCQLNTSGCSIPPTTTYNTMTTASNWSVFDVSTLFAGAKGFASSVFDGRYLYFVPNNNGAVDGLVVRYDSNAGFGSSGSWESFDISTINGGAKGFIGGAFDGRYVYFVPYNNGAYDGVIARFDTQDSGGFGGASAWSTFDIATVNPNAKGFVNAAFDGRYLYLSPHYNGAYDGITVRYDTQASFTSASSWQSFDISTVNASAKGFLGLAYDGRYVYYAPYYNGTAYHGVVARFDTRATGGFTAAASWSVFNVASVNANAVGFYSITFDGKYVYLGQYYDGTAAVPAYDGFVARYDTTASFTTAGSWSVYNAMALNANARGFVGAAFDGRYAYFASHYDGTNFLGMAVRYDTQAATFNAAASWSVFDTTTLNANAKGFHGIGFDGQYIYMVANSTAAGAVGVIARFNAKSPSWLPLGWNAAFD